MRPRNVLTAAIAIVVLAAAPSAGAHSSDTPAVFASATAVKAANRNLVQGCPLGKRYTQAEHRAYVRKVLLHHDRLSVQTKRRMLRLRICQHSVQAARNALHRTRRLRRVRRAVKTARVVAPVGGILARIRACESHGNYGTNTGNGFYGAYQFTLSTWASVGGSGNPAAASPAEQDRRAAMLLARSGTGPWPVCGA